jgi:hypothetical protein
MGDMKNNEFYIGKTKYSIAEMSDLYREDASYYKRLTIDKDNEYWSVVEIGVTDQACVGWEITTKKQIDLNEFLSQISPYITMIGIYSNEIKKIGEEGKIESRYIFMSNPKSKNVNSISLKVCSTPEETIEHYKKEAEKIDKPRIGFV